MHRFYDTYEHVTKIMTNHLYLHYHSPLSEELCPSTPPGSKSHGAKDRGATWKINFAWYRTGSPIDNGKLFFSNYICIEYKYIHIFYKLLLLGFMVDIFWVFDSLMGVWTCMNQFMGSCAFHLEVMFLDCCRAAWEQFKGTSMPLEMTMTMPSKMNCSASLSAKPHVAARQQGEESAWQLSLPQKRSPGTFETFQLSNMFGKK